MRSVGRKSRTVIDALDLDLLPGGCRIPVHGLDLAIQAEHIGGLLRLRTTCRSDASIRRVARSSAT